MGGVIGGVISGTAMPTDPVMPKDKGPRAPVRVGGRVKEPRLIMLVDPKYPQLAIMTHITGKVVIDAIISEQGDVVEAQVSAPPILIQSALEAVRKWKYEPTYLNEQPVPVQLKVTVSFQLNNDFTRVGRKAEQRNTGRSAIVFQVAEDWAVGWSRYLMRRTSLPLSL
jgi:TonB family protein